MNKEEIKRSLSITKLLTYYGARLSKAKGSFYCFRHEDSKPSLIANDERGVATCASPKCDIKAGSDIFQIIKLVENCNFHEAQQKAIQIAGLDFLPLFEERPKPNYPNPSIKPDNVLDTLPETFSLENKHIIWLKNRFGEEWEWVVNRFKIRGWFYHIAVPINADSMVFIPLNKQTKENPKGDHTFYRGKNRGCQLFPNFVEDQAKARKIFVCEGEKDVMRVELEMHKKGILGEWAVITNTIGAINLREDTPIFKNFNPDFVEQIVICYDNDEVGEAANQIAYQNAKQVFTEKTKVKIFNFPTGTPKGYDITNFLNDRQKLVL